MPDFKLPDIVPAAPAPAPTAAIERAGAAFKEAATAVGNASLEADMAQVATQTQEAALQTTKGLNDTLHVIKSNPYLSPAQVRDLFGGNVPAGISLTEPVVVPGQAEPVQQDRTAIPMHEVAPHLFEQQANATLENAAQGIRTPAWQAGFRQAAAKDVERARAEALDWQRGQRLADAEIRSVSQFQQAVSSRSWDTAKAILGNADFTMDVRTRETLRAKFPEMQTEAVVSDRLRSNSVQDLDKLIQDIDANKGGGDPAKGEFVAPLPADKQYHYVERARTRKHEIIVEQAAAAKAAKEARYQAVGDQVQQAITLSTQTGRPASSFLSVAMLPLDLDVAEYNTLRGMLEADPKRATEPEAYLELSSIAKTPGRLGQLSPQEIYGYLPRLSPQDGQTWMDRWSKDKANPGSEKPPVSDYEEKLIDGALDFMFGPDRKKKDPKSYATAKMTLTRNLLDEKARKPGELVLADTVTELAARTFARNTDPDNNMIGIGPDNQWEALTKLLSPEAMLGMQRGVRSLRKGPLTTNDMVTHYRGMKEMETWARPLWEAINYSEDLTDYRLAEVYFSVKNPQSRRALESAARARLDANPATAGKPVDDRELAAQAILQMAPEESTQHRQEAEARAERAAKLAQVQAAGAEERAAAQAAAKQQTAAEAAAAKAERIRHESLPGPVRQAENWANAEFQRQETALESQIRARVYAEDRAAQQAASGGRAVLGQRYAEDPVRVEMDRRVAAEAAVGRGQRKAEWDAQQAEARAAYQKYWEANMVNADGSTKVFAPPGFITDVQKWIQLRREGKL